MHYLGPRILKNLDESYFINPSSRPTSFNDEEKAHLYKAYNESMNPNGQYGFSKSQNSIYLKMFKVLFYETGGYVVLPIYIMNNSRKGIYEEKNLQFRDWWDNYSFKCTREEYKGLKETTYNHSFADGRVIEYIFETTSQVKEQYIEKMYYDTTRLKNYTLLKEELETDSNGTPAHRQKRMKI